MATPTIKSINDLLEMELCIPEYQRPYKWTRRNIAALLDDMDEAISRSREFATASTTLASYKYRLGTIILHRNDGKYDIVDGQQRIISLLIISRILHINKIMPYNFVKMNLGNKETQAHLADNYTMIKDWFTIKKNLKDFVESYSQIFQVVVIIIEDLSEAFQLFDSQNSRGRPLTPANLLKAYHLREMKDEFQILQDVKNWENLEKLKSVKIDTLLATYLYRIINWCDCRKAPQFTKNDIDIFKGMPASSEYSYVRRTVKAMPIFQINEPFISGHDFFAMVDHYMAMLEYIKSKVQSDAVFISIKNILENKKWKNNIGFQHANILFECALLYYYDRFQNLDPQAVNKLFVWAFMLRLDMNRLGEGSINCYSIGENGHGYSNEIAMFFEIKHARLHRQITQLSINIFQSEDKNQVSVWQELYELLQTL